MVKIKVPKQIKIGAVVANIAMAPYIRIDEGWKGCYNQRTNELLLDKNGDSDMRDRTFGHEILHVASINYECELSEENTSRLGNALVELFTQLGIKLDWSEIEESNA